MWHKDRQPIIALIIFGSEAFVLCVCAVFRGTHREKPIPMLFKASLRRLSWVIGIGRLFCTLLTLIINFHVS